MWRRGLFFLSVWVFLASGPVAGDEVEGRLTASLKDGSEIPYTRARIELVDEATRDVIAGPVLSDGEGFYTFGEVPSGNYEIEITVFLEGEPILLKKRAQIGDPSHQTSFNLVVPPVSVLADARIEYRVVDIAAGEVEPVAMFRGRQGIYVVSGAESKIYLLRAAASDLEMLGYLDLSGKVTSHCLLVLEEGDYIVSVTGREVSEATGLWLNYLYLTPLDVGGSPRLESPELEKSLGFGRYRDVVCDGRASAVYILDLAKSEVIEMKVRDGDFSGREKGVATLKSGRRFDLLARRGGRFYVSSFLDGGIYELGPGEGSVRQIVDRKYNPLSLLFSPDGSLLYFLSSGGKQVFYYDLSSEEVGEMVGESAGLEEPRSIALDHAGDLLVGDIERETIFKIYRSKSVRLDEP